MSDERLEIENRLKSYVEVFLELEPTKVLPFFNIPLLFISDEGVHNFTDRKQLLKFLTDYMVSVKVKQYSAIQISGETATLLNPTNATGSFDVERYDQDRNKLPNLEATYAFIKTGGEWKIVVASVLDHSGEHPVGISDR